MYIGGLKIEKNKCFNPSPKDLIQNVSEEVQF